MTTEELSTIMKAIEVEHLFKAYPGGIKAVDAMRSMVLTGDYSQVPLDVAVLGVFTALMIVTASLVLRKLVQ